MYGLINLAGRQLQPNIAATMAFARTGRLALNIILHSDNLLDSALPAVRTLEVLSHDGASHGVKHLRIEVDETLQGVRETVGELFQEFPDLRWILHATGGNKMMSAALVQMAAHPQVACVIYRDLAKGWQTLRPNETAETIESPVVQGCGEEEALLNDEVKLDRLPLLDSIRAQFVDSGALASLDANTAIEAADPEAWIRQVRNHHSRSFRSYLPAGNLPGDGAAFEAWLCSVLQMAGVRQVLWNCTGRSTDGQPVLECDVVAIHGDRIAIFDIKIDKPNAVGKTGQIRSAAETTKLLGGLSAKCVVVRPNWPHSVTVRNLASALNVSLITSQDSGEFLLKLLEPLGLGNVVAEDRALMRVQDVLNKIYRSSSHHVFRHGAV